MDESLLSLATKNAPKSQVGAASKATECQVDRWVLPIFGNRVARSSQDLAGKTNSRATVRFCPQMLLGLLLIARGRGTSSQASRSEEHEPRDASDRDSRKKQSASPVVLSSVTVLKRDQAQVLRAWHHGTPNKLYFICLDFLCGLVHIIHVLPYLILLFSLALTDASSPPPSILCKSRP